MILLHMMNLIYLNNNFYLHSLLTCKEIKQAVDRLKDDKAPGIVSSHGPKSAYSSLLRERIVHIDRGLCRFLPCNFVFVPEEFINKGDPSYRPITLLSCLGNAPVQGTFLRYCWRQTETYYWNINRWYFVYYWPLKKKLFCAFIQTLSRRSVLFGEKALDQDFKKR